MAAGPSVAVAAHYLFASPAWLLLLFNFRAVTVCSLHPHGSFELVLPLDA